MELENMKDLWNEKDKTGKVPGDKISEIIRKPSRGPVARMKRNLRYELVTVILSFGLIAVYYFIAFDSKYSLIGWVYAFFIVLFCYYFIRKSKLLENMQCSSCHIKSNLELQVKMLEKYTRFYLISGTAIIPLLMIFLGILLYYKKPGLANGNILYPSADNPVWKFLLAWFILLSVTTMIIYLLNRSYVNRLYGRHIQRLKQLLSQINE